MLATKSLLSIQEVLTTDDRALRALEALGCKIKFVPFKSGQYSTAKAIGDYLGVSSALVSQAIKASPIPELFETLGLFLINEKSVAEEFMSAAGLAANQLGFFGVHGVLNLYNPRVTLALVVLHRTKVGDIARKYFDLPALDLKLKRQVALLVSQQYEGKGNKSLSQNGNGNAAAIEIVELSRPKYVPEPCQELTYTAYSDASVRSTGDGHGLTVLAVHFPDEETGVIKVLKGSYPIKVAELQASAMAVQKRGKRVQQVFTDNLDNVRELEVVRKHGSSEWQREDWAYAGYRAFVDRGVDLIYTPREKNFVADYLSKYPGSTAKEGTFWFDVKVDGERVELIPHDLPKVTAPTLATSSTEVDIKKLMEEKIVIRGAEADLVRSKIQALKQQIQPFEERLEAIDSEILVLRQAASLL